MPLDISTVAAGLKIQATHVTQYYNLLTGAMTDQNVALLGPKNYFNGLGCLVSNTSTFNLSDATATAATFDTELFDTDNMHSTVSNTGQIVCRTAGIYLAFGFTIYAANATGIRRTTIRRNGSISPVGGGTGPGDGTYTTEVTAIALYQMVVNDYFELIMFQDRGGALVCTPVFGAVKVA